MRTRRKIPLFPIWKKGSCEEIQPRGEKRFLLSGEGANSRRQNRREIDGRKALPPLLPSDAGNMGIPFKNKRVFPSAKLSYVPCRPRRNQRLFWRREFDIFPGMPKPPNFPVLFFSQLQGGGRGMFRLFIRPDGAVTPIRILQIFLAGAEFTNLLPSIGRKRMLRLSKPHGSFLEGWGFLFAGSKDFRGQGDE